MRVLTSLYGMTYCLTMSQQYGLLLKIVTHPLQQCNLLFVHALTA